MGLLTLKKIYLSNLFFPKGNLPIGREFINMYGYGHKQNIWNV